MKERSKTENKEKARRGKRKGSQRKQKQCKKQKITSKRNAHTVSSERYEKNQDAIKQKN